MPRWFTSIFTVAAGVALAATSGLLLNLRLHARKVNATRKKVLVPLLAVAAAAFIWSALSIQIRGQGQIQLPDGPGKDLVVATCSECHSLNLISNSWGYTREGWQELFSSMVAMPSIQASPVADYLATHFPEKPNTPRAVIVPGRVEVDIREWLLPTLGQRPRDPLAARDGSIWWAGQYANRVGRLDPTTSAAHEYPLPTRNSGPHGLAEDVNGNIWYTGVNVRRIGRLDPSTEIITEYPMPDPLARGPHTPVFDQQGMLFFTLQSGHVGRLDPATGEVRLGRTPTDHTYPYGIQVNSKGVPWYVDFNGNRVGSVDPATMEITEYALPNPASRPRRLALTPDDAVWYMDASRGYLGRFDPATGQVREWRSPSGGRSQPYGIAAVGNVLWYSESGVKPNTLVRFDSRCETFQSWAIPSGSGNVRNMMATPEGNLVLASSTVNRVALVEVRNPTGPELPCPTPTPSPTPTPTPTPAPSPPPPTTSPYDGSWTGSGTGTSSARTPARVDITFQASGATISTLRITFRIDMPPGASQATCGGTSGFVGRINNGAFAVSGGIVFPMAVAGTFTSPDSIAGTVQITPGTGAPAMCPSATINWSGRKQ